ncbi:MAG TPA: hypothetical protein VND95_15115 [Stellaceae bacterium]|nr:hypothetical protein [Stellaceae bacterium]
MTTDEEAEAFLDGDLSDLDFTQFKPTRFQFTDEHVRQESVARPKSVTSRPLISQLPAGTPAPRTGLYEQRGPRGGRTGQQADTVRGQPLPPTPSGRTWMLVEPADRTGDVKNRRSAQLKGGERRPKRDK